MAPLMRATVIAAKVNWKPTKTSSGMSPCPSKWNGLISPSVPASPNFSNGLAMMPARSWLPKDIEYP